MWGLTSSRSRQLERERLRLDREAWLYRCNCDCYPRAVSLCDPHDWAVVSAVWTRSPSAEWVRWCDKCAAFSCSSAPCWGNWGMACSHDKWQIRSHRMDSRSKSERIHSTSLAEWLADGRDCSWSASSTWCPCSPSPCRYTIDAMSDLSCLSNGSAQLVRSVRSRSPAESLRTLLKQEIRL